MKPPHWYIFWPNVPKNILDLCVEHLYCRGWWYFRMKKDNFEPSLQKQLYNPIMFIQSEISTLVPMFVIQVLNTGFYPKQIRGIPRIWIVRTNIISEFHFWNHIYPLWHLNLIPENVKLRRFIKLRVCVFRPSILYELDHLILRDLWYWSQHDLHTSKLVFRLTTKLMMWKRRTLYFFLNLKYKRCLLCNGYFFSWILLKNSRQLILDQTAPHIVVDCNVSKVQAV